MNFSRLTLWPTLRKRRKRNWMNCSIKQGLWVSSQNQKIVTILWMAVFNKHKWSITLVWLMFNKHLPVNLEEKNEMKKSFTMTMCHFMSSCFKFLCCPVEDVVYCSNHQVSASQDRTSSSINKPLTFFFFLLLSYSTLYFVYILL